MVRTDETAPPRRPDPQDHVSPGRGTTGWLGPLLRRLHFFAGVLVGPFILISALSGALYVLSPQLEQVVYADQLHVPASSTSLPIAAQVEIAEEHVDGAAPLTAVRPAPGPEDTTRVLFAQEGLEESESRSIFIDPGTGEIRGDLTVYGTSGSLPLRAWIDHFHRSLHLGDVGRLYSELSASWLWIVASAGLVLWMTRRHRTRAARPAARSRPLSGHRRLLNWHTTLGLCVVLGALFLSATGITWSQHAGANVTALRTTLGWDTPVVNTAVDGHSGSGAHSEHHGGAAATAGGVDLAHIDHVLDTARDVNIDSDLVEILPPDEPGAAWTVQEIHRSYPTQVDVVAIDPATLEVVDRVDFADYPFMAKLARWGVDLHMGTLFGLVNQIVLAGIAVGIATMVVLGYAMWWKRRPTRAQGLSFGRPPRRGALGGVPWWGLAAIATAAGAIGVVLPMVGWPLLCFLALDVALGLVHRRRASIDARRPRR